MGFKKIGVACGVNPLPGLKIKAWLIATGSDLDMEVEVVESAQEMPLEPPTPRIALGDRKIAAFLAASELQKAGCEAVIIPDVRTEPFLPELQKELQVPVISLFAGLPESLKAEGIRRIGLLGRAVPQDFYEKIFGADFEFVKPAEDLTPIYDILQSPGEALKKHGFSSENEEMMMKAGEKLLEAGAEVLIPNCTQMARFAEELRLRGLPVIDLLRNAAVEAVRATPKRLPKPFKVGLIGGLGPAATVDLYDKIVKATPAKTDQEHIKVVVEQNPQIPDRTAALLRGGVDPTLAMFNCAKRLEDDDCDAIIVPCNTAHAFLPYLQRFIRTPFIKMQQAALDEIKAKLGDKARIGLLATTGTVQTGIYSDKAKAMGLAMFVPDAEHQERVMAAIYGPKGAKAGYTDGVCREDLLSAAEVLVRDHGCNCLILGCTELPLILDESDDFEVAGAHVVVIDPTAALARKVVKTAEEAFERTGIH